MRIIMRINVFICALTAVCLVSPHAEAKARYMSLAETVARSDLVALVDVLKVQPVASHRPPLDTWGYRQRAELRVVRSFKRAPTVPADEATRPLTVWAEKEFICARASLKPGRYVLFLRRVTDSEYVVVNHEYGARAVLKGMLDLSFYDRGAKQRPVTAFPAMLAKALPDGPSGPIAVKIAKSVIWANQWVPQQPMQKLYVSLNNNVRSWPNGLSWMVPALFSPTLLSRQRFERLTRAPHGTWKMVGVWRKGSFLLTSIEKI